MDLKRWIKKKLIKKIDLKEDGFKRIDFKRRWIEKRLILKEDGFKEGFSYLRINF